ncbi:MAG: hypothetical protein OIN85_00780 [Candidatus Methanoperedens sp.]|nr:hypothetical protein [Candidatus Methanoperedens sp.]
MGLREEIEPYVDGNRLVAPNTGDWKEGERGSDNGVMFTSEYIIMLLYIMRDSPYDPFAHLDTLMECEYKSMALWKCLKSWGLLSRAPGDPDQEGPDDYYGYCAALKVMRESLPWHQSVGAFESGLGLLWHGITHLGFFNNTDKFNWSAFLWRQPQMVAAMASAAGLGWIPFFWPFYLIAALVIATSCIWAPRSDTDARRLSWLLIQATKSSPLCWLASKLWYRRLYKTYPNGMKDVAALYYCGGHPFTKYWITE